MRQPLFKTHFDIHAAGLRCPYPPWTPLTAFATGSATSTKPHQTFIHSTSPQTDKQTNTTSTPTIQEQTTTTTTTTHHTTTTLSFQKTPITHITLLYRSNHAHTDTATNTLQQTQTLYTDTTTTPSHKFKRTTQFQNTIKITTTKGSG